MWTWKKSYSRDGDYLVLEEADWWVPVLETIGSPFIHFGITYPFSNWLLGLTEKGLHEIFRMPLPDELYDAWWRD